MSPIEKGCVKNASTTSSTRTHLGLSFGLAAACVVVVVRAAVSIFMHSVQEPEQELEGVVLGVAAELRGVLGHRTLGTRETTTFILGSLQKSLNTNSLRAKGGQLAGELSRVQSWPNADSSKNSGAFLWALITLCKSFMLLFRGTFRQACNKAKKSYHFSQAEMRSPVLFMRCRGFFFLIQSIFTS